VVLVVQARIGSRRLPGKMLAGIVRRPAIAWLLQRAGGASRVDEVRLAIPEGAENDELAAMARTCGCACTRGAEEDCLGRFLQAARESDADHVVRVSGDSPFIDPEMIDAVVADHLATGADYTRNFEPIDIPAGLCVEAFTRAALERAAAETGDPYDREHVTPYFYRRPGRFRVRRTPVPAELLRPDVRLTLDTEEDLQALRQIAGRFPGRDDFSAREIVDLLDSSPDIAAINRQVDQRALARVAFWIDYGPRIGAGHLTRARALADALAIQGIRSKFFFRSQGFPQGGAADPRLEELVPNGHEGFAASLGRAAADYGASCAVLDNYSATPEDAGAVRSGGIRLAVVDDLCRPWDADLIVNPNAGASREPYLAAGTGAELLAGCEYALIPRELVARAAATPREAPAGRPRVLVVFGGSDPAGLTAATCTGLLESGAGLELEVVLGPLVPEEGRRAVRELVGGAEPVLRVHESPASLAPMFQRAHLAVGAGGITKYELALFGVPAVLVAVADNQVASCRALSRAGACEYVGEAFGPAAVGTAELVERAVRLLADEPRRRAIALAASAAVDGGGAQRVAAAVAKLAGVRG
jgi:spore coat polysaccharide biosynthesis protein SpsF (cytidylyltransferase family)/spore coat polysaccharide biosynthesis predicted glycosyltransferase SpsG